MKKKLIAYLGSGALTREDAGRLTHVNVAFGKLEPDGTIREKTLAGEDIEKYKSWNPELKFILSLVQTQSNSFTSVCASKEYMHRMGEEAVRIVTTTPYDGIDLDWEYPCVPSNGQDTCPEDKYRFTELIKTLREHLDGTGAHHLLTIAAGADLYYAECTELDKIAVYLDYINLMTYDLKCGFHALAGHHTPLYSSTGDYFRNSCDQALRLFHDRGVPKEKLLLGAAMYSRMAEGLQDRNHGLLQICRKPFGYGPDYTTLAKDYINKNGYVRYWDDEAKAPWLFNGSTFISYDDPESMRCKAQYVLDHDYGGVFYWEHRCDTTGALLGALYDVLK
ncbi:MAG: chitinase [Clostridia bacterium]|nr:chitinase [Clostridia bacterium]